MNTTQPLLQVEMPDARVGVLVGRFQVPALHDGHHDLIRSVMARHQKVLVFLGSTPGVLVTRRNPLDFYTRSLMLREAYPGLIVLPLADRPDDGDWSESLDEAIADAVGDSTSAVIYGSRDSFIPAYSGRYPTLALAESKQLSGTQVRKSVSDEVRESEDFRRGIIYAAFNRHPVSFQTVDIIVRRTENVLVARKKNDPQGKWRFIGGFVNPNLDASLEAAARRELFEEAGITCVPPVYVGSTPVDDWRYRNDDDSILTAVFEAHYTYGAPKAADDIHEVKWHPLADLERILVEQHLPILSLYSAYLQGEPQ